MYRVDTFSKIYEKKPLVNIVFSRYYSSMKTLQVYNYLERINNLLRSDARLKGAEHGLQPVQLEALHYLSICNKFSDTPMAVTEYLGQTKGTVSQTLKVLEKKKYLTKHGDKDDKRITHLKVTNTGSRLLDDSIPTPKFMCACEELPEELQTVVSSALNQLLLSFIDSNEMKSFGVCSSCRYHQQKTGNRYFCNLVEEPLKKNDIQLICREHRIRAY